MILSLPSQYDPRFVIAPLGEFFLDGRSRRLSIQPSCLIEKKLDGRKPLGLWRAGRQRKSSERKTQAQGRRQAAPRRSERVSIFLANNHPSKLLPSDHRCLLLFPPM